MSPIRGSVLLTLVALAVTVAPASAVSGPLPSAYVADDVVQAILGDGQGGAYIGGLFTHVGPRLGHGIALTTSSSAPAAGFPDVNGEILASVADGSGGWFIGGSFTAVGGVTRGGLAHIKADRTLDKTFSPDAPNNVVRALALSGNALFVGGDFTKVGDATRVRMAKVDATTGALDAAFLAGSGSSVNALLVVGANLYAGTSGSISAGVTRLGRLDTTSGNIDASFTLIGDGAVFALAASGTSLFAGGTFAATADGTHSGVVKIDTASGTIAHNWTPQIGVVSPTGVRSLVVTGTDLLVGGRIFNVGTTASDPSPLTRDGLAKLAVADPGTPAGWAPTTGGGTVNSLAVSGDDVVVGGQYTTLVGQVHASLGKVRLSSGSVDGTWHPDTGAIVDTVAFSGSSLLAGGTFASAGPQNLVRNGVAHLNADGTLDAAWNPDLDGPVYAMALSGTSLYLGGAFAHVNGTSQTALAKVSTTDGSLDGAWNPVVTSTGSTAVAALALSGDDLFVGGGFTAIDSGSPNRSNLAKLSASTGELDPTWNPGPTPPFLVQTTVTSLAVSGGSVYVGGIFNQFQAGSTQRNGIAKIPVTGDGTPDATWNPNAGPNSTVNAIAVSGSDVFVGGNFGSIGGQLRNRLAKLSAAGTGAADATWNPNASQTVYGLAVDGNELYAVGAFSSAGGQSRRNVLRTATTGTGAADAAFAVPPAGSTVSAVAVGAPGRVFFGGVFSSIGNLSATGIGLYDMTPPSASITVPAEGGRYRQGQSVNAGYSCGDPDGAGNVASCSGPVANGVAFDTSTAGARTFTVTATDAGGDTGSATVNYFVDASAPTVGITAPAQGAAYTQGQVVDAGYSCDDVDGASDVTSCTGTVAKGTAIDTSIVGTHTFSVTSTDAAGNSTTDAVSYTVSTPVIPDTTAPAITSWRISPATFRAAGSGASVAARKKTPVGARVSYVLSEAAPKVVVTVLRLRKGRKPQSLGRFTVRGRAGANQFRFTGRLNGGKLSPGSYRLSAKATDAAKNTSTAAQAGFKIVRK